eukprot:3115341-Amphidinium_carterae.1
MTSVCMALLLEFSPVASGSGTCECISIGYILDVATVEIQSRWTNVAFLPHMLPQNRNTSEVKP